VHVGVIATTLFDDTRTFLRTLAAQPAVDVTLLKGDADPEAALRTLRDAHRLWFEGAGPLLSALADRPAADWLAGAYLRIGPDEVDRLPRPGLWRLVRTVVVPDAATAERVRRLEPAPASARVRVDVAGEATDRVGRLSARAGDLRAHDWTAILRLAEACHGRVRILGDAPTELAEVLARAYGLEVTRGGPAETRVTWRANSGGRHTVERLRPQADAALPVGPPPREADHPWPLVSAVVPAYNAQDTIDRCLESLRRQTYPNLEILVIDDGSTDGTAETVAKHLNDPRVRYFDKPHSGRPETRNRGIAEARGHWIAWLDADDEAMPNRIRTQVEAAHAAGRADVVHADGLLLRPDGAVTFSRRGRGLTAEDLPARLLAGLAAICPVLNTSTLVRRDLYDRLGRYDPAFQRGQDYEFWCRCAAAGDVRFVHVPVPLVKVYRAALTDQMRRQLLTSVRQIARRLIEMVGAEALVDPVARDLHDPPAMVIGRVLLATGIGVKGPGRHPIFTDAESYLRRGLEEARGASRREAALLLQELADYRRRTAATSPQSPPAGPAGTQEQAAGGTTAATAAIGSPTAETSTPRDEPQRRPL